MTNVLIDMEIVKAIGLSITFMGVMLSIVAIGIAIFIYKSSKQKGRQYLKMAGLILGWSVFIVLSNVKEFFNISISYSTKLL